MERIYKTACTILLKWVGLSILVLSSYAADAQIITFKKMIGGPRTDSGRDLEICPNGDYLVVGVSTSYSQGDSDIYVMRTDQYGNELWKKTLGGFGQDLVHSIDQTSDGNYVIAGYTSSSGAGSYDIYVAKIDGNANVLWEKTYGGAGWDMAREIRQTADGGYIVTGYSSLSGTSNFDAFLLKLDAGGNQQWMKYYGGALMETSFSVKELPGATGYILFGSTYTYGVGNGDFYLVKTNPSGDTLWTRAFGGPGNEEGQYVWITSDGGYILVGDQQSNSAGDYDVGCRKFDANGNQVWASLFGGTLKDVVKMIQPTLDGNYVIAAITRSFGLKNPDFWILKIDGNGTLLWDKTYGGDEHEHCYVVKQTNDGGFIAAGHTDSAPSAGIDVFMVKTDVMGKIIPVGVAELNLANAKVLIYPNPVSDKITVSFKQALASKCTIRLMNAMGQVVFSQDIGKTEDPVSFDCSTFAKGLYLLDLRNDAGQVTQKVILE